MITKNMTEIIAKSVFFVFKYVIIDNISKNPPRTKAETTKKYMAASDNICSPLHHFKVDDDYQH